MPTFGYEYLARTIAATEAPCVSLYMPTHRHHPDNAQDPIRFKNLVKEVEASLNRGYQVREVRALMEPFQRMQDDPNFWNHTLDGLAVLASPSRFDVFKSPRTVREHAVVADSFFVKPLLRYLQSADRFHVLAVAEANVALYEGNRYVLDPIPMPPVAVAARPRDANDANAPLVMGEGTTAYFREIDRVVTEEVSKPTRVPLVLAALAENRAIFRNVAKNPHLIAETISIDPFALDAEALRVAAWKLLEPHYLARLKKLTEDFGTAVSRELGTGDLSDAARAAIAGRIGILLVDADQMQPGKIDPVTGAIEGADLADPSVDDKLDDLAEMVLKTGGDVVVVPGDRMPTRTGLAAIYRF